LDFPTRKKARREREKEVEKEERKGGEEEEEEEEEVERESSGQEERDFSVGEGAVFTALLQCQGRASVSGLPGSSSVAHTPPRGKGAAVTVIKFRKLHGPPMKRALIGSLATASAEAKPDPDQTPGQNPSQVLGLFGPRG
jgi:hypothetical protein